MLGHKFLTSKLRETPSNNSIWSPVMQGIDPVSTQGSAWMGAGDWAMAVFSGEPFQDVAVFSPPLVPPRLPHLSAYSGFTRTDGENKPLRAMEDAEAFS